MDESVATAIATKAAAAKRVFLRELKSSIIEFGWWIFCFEKTAGGDWWAAVNDEDGEVLEYSDPPPPATHS